MNNYSQVFLYGHAVLFSDVRIDKNSVPQGLYRYEIRHSDCGFKPAQIALGVWVNFYGTVISDKNLLQKENYREIDDGDFAWDGERFSLAEYMEKSNADIGLSENDILTKQAKINSKTDRVR